MTYRDVLAILTTGEEAQALRAAKLVAGEGRIAAVHLFEMPEVVASYGPEMLALWPQLLGQTRSMAAAEQKQIQQQLDSLALSTNLQSFETPRGLAGHVVAQKAQYADISVMQSPRSELGAAVFEGALFQSGRPILLVPRAWKGETLGKRILIAWKPTREAARAVADARPFVAGAQQITVITVDAAKDENGRDPGAELAAYLARAHGAVEARNIDSRGNPAEEVLIDEAKAMEADLIVMGGYGHGRLTEFVFGGVTRSLSRDCPVPTLMSH